MSNLPLGDAQLLTKPVHWLGDLPELMLFPLHCSAAQFVWKTKGKHAQIFLGCKGTSLLRAFTVAEFSGHWRILMKKRKEAVLSREEGAPRRQSAMVAMTVLLLKEKGKLN